MKTIYCVEDDENIRELIEYTLGSMGFEVCGFGSAAAFYDALSKKTPSLVLLDIMLPDSDGMQILSHIRATPAVKKLPVIMLTAKAGRIDKIKGLDSGADDYITKPFDVLELVSRINALLRRCEQTDDNILTYNEITVDTARRKVTANNEEIPLTYKEFELLKQLLINNGIVLTRDRLMNDVWGTDFEGETRTVDVHIRTLRQKLGKYGDYIETVRNVGYKVG